MSDTRSTRDAGTTDAAAAKAEAAASAESAVGGAPTAGPAPIPVGPTYGPYAWAVTTEEVVARHGLRPEQVLRYDQNTPPFPGIPQIPLSRSFADLNRYPDGQYRALREAAAAYVGHGVSWEQVIVGAGADDLILLCARVYLGPGRRSAISGPTYVLYRLATELAGAEHSAAVEGATVIWRCNPNNPTGDVTPADELVALASSHPDAVVVVDEAYVEFGGETLVGRIEEAPNLVVIRTMSKAFGFASLRVGYAVASPSIAALLEDRRAPAPIAGPAAAIATAALREPRYDLEPVVTERERVRTALVSAGHDCPPTATNFVWLRTDDSAALSADLEQQGIVVRTFPTGIRITLRGPADDDVLLRALGADTPSRGRRTAMVVRTTTETGLRVTIDVDGRGQARVATGIGFLDHLLTLLAFHAGFDLDVEAGGDLEVDEHHTTEDVLAALGSALTEALGDRDGVTRYGSAVVPMDEARASAAVDLVRRPHAEIALAFGGDRVGELPVSLLAHALERLTVEAGCTIHVEAAGSDDHHVAEAAFKALGRALKEACAPGEPGVRSTKGIA